MRNCESTMLIKAGNCLKCRARESRAKHVRLTKYRGSNNRRRKRCRTWRGSSISFTNPLHLVFPLRFPTMYWDPCNQTGKTNANPRYISVVNYGYCSPEAAKSDYPVELKTNVYTYAIEMLGAIFNICVFICLALLLYYKIINILVFPRGVLLNYPDLLEKVHTS